MGIGINRLATCAIELAGLALNTDYSNRDDADRGHNTGETDDATYSADNTDDASGHDGHGNGADDGTSNSGDRRGNAPRREDSLGQRLQTPVSPRSIQRGFDR